MNEKQNKTITILQEVNGGDALLAALIAAGVTLFGTGFAGGIAVGLNRVNN